MLCFLRNARYVRFVAGLLLFCAGQLAAQTLVVTSLSSTSGAPGSSLTITGSGFNTTTSMNTVYIGGVRATVTAATATSLTVTVPGSAVYGRVSVVNTASGLVDLSPQMFLPTFTPALGRALEASDFVMTTTASGVTAHAMEPVDLDDDGKLDIVLTTYTSDNITYRLNTSTPGSISFGAEATITVPGFAGMQDLQAGDLDGDGQMDIVAVSQLADKFVVLRRTGVLTFAQTTVDTGDEPRSVTLVDVDNDGKLDVVVAHSSFTIGVHVYRNTTVGSTISFAAAVTYTGTIGAGASMTVADFNADGKDDILIARDNPRDVRVMENASSGPGNVAFLTSTEVDLGTHSFPVFITTAEFDGDGKIDAIAPFAATAATTAGILANTSTATNVSFSDDLATLASVGGSQNTAAVGDLTGDGKPDLVLPMASDADPTPGYLYRTAVYTNTSTSGAIGFAPKLELSTTAMTAFANASLVADLDGDDRPDLLVYHRNAGRMVFYRNAPVQAPVTQATNLQMSSTTLLPTSATISWTRGSGQRVAVFMSADTASTPAPADLTDYTPNPVFGSGTQIGSSGWYTVATGEGASVTVTGLTQNTAYRVMVVEYNNNGVAGAAVYQTATATANPLNFTTPAPVGITSLARSDASPTNAATVAYTLTLNGDVHAGMTTSRFSLTTTGTIAGASIASVSGSGASYTINVNTGTGSGNITLDVANASGIVPGISTTLPWAGETYTMDRAALALTAVTIASDYADPGIAYAGNTVTLNFTAAETITPTVQIAGQAVTATNTGGFDWTAAYILTTSDTLGAVPFDITFVDGLGNAGTSVTTTTDASAVVMDVVVQADETFIDGAHSNVDLTGPLYIQRGAIINGGTLTGDIYNDGLIRGTITLGPGTTIQGGTISGTIKGNPASPAVLLAVTITANTVLEHVIIGRGTVLSPDAVIGAGVRFESRSLIPPGLELTGALNPFRWSGSSELTIVDLGGDVLRIPTRTILQALQLLAGADGNELGAAANGELTLSAQNARGMLLPVRVRQAARDTAPGTYIDDDGNIVFVTAEGYEVLTYSVLLADAFFDEVLAGRGLRFAYDTQGRLLVVPSSHDRVHFVGKASAAAVPAQVGDTPGLQSRGIGYVLVFEDEDGVLMAQELVPVAADWPALRETLAAIPEVSDVTLGVHGTITVTLDGRRVSGRMSHQVSQTIADFPALSSIMSWAGDLNGDGAGDYYVFYPRASLVQVLFVDP